VIKQHSAALELGMPGMTVANPVRSKLDAIFVVAGGGSLLAGVAAVIKKIIPHTKVVGVESEGADLLYRSLLTGRRMSRPEPAHFVDGASVRDIGSEVFRLCDELVDDVITVTNDEICAAVCDCFEDTRAMLEPAGAMSVAGLKKWLGRQPVGEDGSKGNYVAILSDASNVEFDLLRFIADRAAIGEQRESVFALRIPDSSGMFFEVYKAVQPRLVTEFTYRYSPAHTDALVFMAMERIDTLSSSEQESHHVINALNALGVHAMDVTGNEMAKTHARYLVGGRPGKIAGERVIRFEFPEQAGALDSFLSALRSDWFVTMLHYRNHGGQVGKVLAGIQVPSGSEGDFDAMLDGLGYTFYDETSNAVYREFLR